MILSSLGIGLLSSGTHCVGMCGPIHLLLRQNSANPAWYHLGRILGYAFQGFLVASLAMSIESTALSSPLKLWFPDYQWFVPVILGSIYLILSLEFLGVPLRLEQRLGKYFPHHRLQNFLRSSRPSRVGAAGFVAAFLPCPSTLAALSLTLVLDQAWLGPLLMIAFGIGTLPGFALLSWKPLQNRLNHGRFLRIALGLYFVFISSKQWLNLYHFLNTTTAEMQCH